MQELGDTYPTTQLHADIKQSLPPLMVSLRSKSATCAKWASTSTVDLHVIADGNLSVMRGHLIGQYVKDAIKSAYPRVADVLVHVEPHDRE